MEEKSVETIKHRTISLKIVSDGSPGGTHIVDATTGEVLLFDGFVSASIMHEGPGKTGSARVVVTFAEVPVEATEAVKAPFTMLGHQGGSKSGVELRKPVKKTAHAVQQTAHRQQQTTNRQAVQQKIAAMKAKATAGVRRP